MLGETRPFSVPTLRGSSQLSSRPLSDVSNGSCPCRQLRELDRLQARRTKLPTSPAKMSMRSQWRHLVSGIQLQTRNGPTICCIQGPNISLRQKATKGMKIFIWLASSGEGRMDTKKRKILVMPFIRTPGAALFLTIS